MQEDGKETWICTCHFSKQDDPEQLMASFRRTSEQAPLNAGGFYSFVEDWDRSPGAEGHHRNRSAVFSKQAVRTAGG